MKIDILGTEYEVVYKNYSEEPLFEKRSIDGYCDDVEKVDWIALQLPKIVRACEAAGAM